MLSLSTNISQLKKVGPAYLKKLNQVGIQTIEDLLFYFPHRYDDFSQIIPISQLKIRQIATVRGKISKISSARTWKKRMNITEALIKDETGSIRSIWFNQPYLIQSLAPRMPINLSGKINSSKKNGLYFSNPVHEIAYNDNFTHTGRLTPIYHETKGLSSRYLRYLIKPLLPLADKISDFLPAQIKQEFKLINLSQAISQIHFPNSQQTAQKARSRLAFDEIFLIQLEVLRQKQDLFKKESLAIPFNQKLIQSFVKNLPFTLTNDQRRAAWQIFQDLNKPKPMNRLLNGDVGSGKTIIAAMAMFQTAKAGYQTGLMAPTEVLAKQHFETLKALFKNYNLSIALLTRTDNIIKDKHHNSVKVDREQLKKQIAKGKIDIAIGTHALISAKNKIAPNKQESLIFNKLALAIIDEQHRFGVFQRAKLIRDIKPAPHFLSMTATAIPRTLTLTIYGDLDISLLKELPMGRQKIITKIITPADRKKTYDFINQQVKSGRQVFVICPLIEKSEKLEAQSILLDKKIEIKSVTEEYKKLSSKIFPHLKIAMIHGQLKSEEKEEIMKKFKNNQINILVSTSVIEVGIDIPNATVMMIEGADRFGLSQLHQFRGRVGRSCHQSYCFLFSNQTAKKTYQRLRALVKCENGFELAEKDLQIRGSGDLTGKRQWGLPDITMASLSNLELIQKARQVAVKILNNNLLSPALEEKLRLFRDKIHFE